MSICKVQLQENLISRTPDPTKRTLDQIK